MKHSLPQNRRVPYIDWLRAFLVLILFFFHTARMFDSLSPFYLKNEEGLPFCNEFVFLVNQWQLPLLFLIAGVGTWFSLEYRSKKEYLKERFKRLLVPFVTGLILLVPPQSYYVLRDNNVLKINSYLEFYKSYFFSWNFQYPLGGDYSGFFELAHLWFLAVLFIFSALCLPFFIRSKKKSKDVGLSEHFKESNPIFLFSIPIVLSEVIPRALFDWEFFQNPFLYFAFFVYGFFLFSRQDFMEKIKRRGGVFALWTLASSLLLIFLLNQGWSVYERVNQPPLLYRVVFELLSGLNIWFWSLLLLSLFQKYLNFKNRILQYLNEAVLPFYILHQTMIIIYGFYVLHTNIGTAVKYLLIVFLSFLATVLVYELLVKRINVVRFLFGMRVRGKGLDKG
ncbi:MAG: acyltransferase family protein [Candidatus Nealsonbacteria bacterium]|nr:acyltransferase family protein [Candidatus Nealsonbacteria bacterium]